MFEIDYGQVSVRRAISANHCSFPLTAIRSEMWDYQRLASDSGAEPADCSFTLSFRGIPVAACLAVRSEDGASYFGQPIRIELAEIDSVETENIWLSKRIASVIVREFGSSNQVSIEISMKSQLAFLVADFLLANASETYFTSDAVAVLAGQKDLRQDLRKSHVQSVNKAALSLDNIETFSGSVPVDVFDEFENLHLTASGRRTRNRESWEEMRKGVLQNRALLATSRLNGKMVGGTFCWQSKFSSLYSTGAYDRTLFSMVPVAHATVFACMLEAQKLGLKEFILGDSYSVGKSAKDKSISLFKRGFTSGRKNCVGLKF